MAGAAVVVLVVAVLYVLRLDRVAGLVVDDAWYILLGQALSQGHGFRLTSSAVAEILPNVPPGFPFILSVLFRLKPHFPENVLHGGREAREGGFVESGGLRFLESFQTSSGNLVAGGAVGVG